MMYRLLIVLGMVGMLCVGSGQAQMPDFAAYEAVMDSLSQVHPRNRASWLRARGLDDSYYTTFRKPESSGLRCVGRWPWGPSWELAGKDSLLFLGSGSGVRILSVADSVNPRMVGQINARGLVSQVVVRDTLLFVACGNWGAQIYGIADPADPKELGSMDAVIYDLAVVDTFCYTVGGKYSPNDSLRIFSVADPARPLQVGAVRDSGDVLVVTRGHAYVAGNVAGMNVYDVRVPTAPYRVNSRAGYHGTLFARGTLLLGSGIQPSYFTILNISDPQAITEVGRISGYGGRALYADDRFAYLSAAYDRRGLFIIDIADSTRPQVLGNYAPAGMDASDSYVPGPASVGYLTLVLGGLAVLDLRDANAPVEVWSGYRGHQAVDIHVDGSRAYLAQQCAGLRILDITESGDPRTLGAYDPGGILDVRSATARDSFAFISYWGQQRRFMRVLDVSDPSAPVFVAEEYCLNVPEDLVLKDSLLYAAQMNRFQIFNVARPREPVLVGSCAGDGVAIAVQDSFAFTSAGATRITNVARPDSPYVVGTITGHRASGIAVRDTFLYIPAAYDTVWVYSVADPARPHMVGYTPMPTHLWDIALADTIAAVATVQGLDIISLTNPAKPERLGGVTTPYGPRRVIYAPPYFYVAMWDAGVGIYAVDPTGLAESDDGPGRTGSLRAIPNPSTGRVILMAEGLCIDDIIVRDVAGRVVLTVTARITDERRIMANLDGLRSGVYFVEAKVNNKSERAKLVIR